MYTIKQKCTVCGKDVMVDQFGQGPCDNCGWDQCLDSRDFPNKVEYPNTISYNKAKALYSQGLALIPDINDFLQGLDMYSEMEFYYEGKRYGVVYDENYAINFYEYENPYEDYQIYKTKEEFLEKANIKGKLLKDIWQNVYNADYMCCY